MTDKVDTAMGDDTNKEEVDEKLYSRQLYVMGHEAQKKLSIASALIVGLSGLGVEVAKNCILAGLSTVDLLDDSLPNVYDMGGNFYLHNNNNDTTTTMNTTSSRAQICGPKLSELNPYVKVNVVTGDVSHHIANYSVVVICCEAVSDTIIAQWNALARQHSTKFIYSTVWGVFGRVFCDFGSNHIVLDKDGEPPVTSQIESVLAEHPAVVKVLEDQGRHNLEDGDQVTFSKLSGVDGLSTNSNYTVKVTGPFTFEIDVDLTNMKTQDESGNPIVQQGYITQVKQNITMQFDDYPTKLETPGEFMLSDFAKMDRPALLHTGFRAVSKYLEEFKELPPPNDATAIAKVLEFAEALDSDVLTDPKNKRILTFLAHGSRACLSPMCAIFGGMVGQEVLKAVSGKFSPINGWFYFDADECLPDQYVATETLADSRYASQVAVFGQDMQQKINDLNYFIIGAGAIGCEMLKNWAMMGVGCGEHGHVHVTDMDRIEKSNLSRQFLFRNSDINGFKSTTAASAVKAMNPDLKITSYQEKVAPETEYMFGDDFYDKLSGVCTALDNVEARLYVDQRCLFYRLPMLESGTLGTKGNTQIVVPRITEHYGATRDPPEKSIPVCTLKNFPNQIQHTLQWARDYFEGEFKQNAEEANQFLSMEPSQYLENLQANTKLETLKTLEKVLKERPESFEDCVTWARLTFEKLFDNQIRQLLHNFPEDQVTASGAKFWSGSKRCPKALTFNVDDEDDDTGMRNHFDFVVAAANLRAEMYGIAGNTDEGYFRRVLQDVIVPDFSPAEGVKIAANDEEAKAQNDSNAMDTSDDAEADGIWQRLLKDSKEGASLIAIDFDKDIDDHMLFVTACSNLRALNYSIPTEDTHRSRAIAGRIIPAIATTTALVTGLICLELYKVVGTARKELDISALKSAYANLAVPFMTLSEPSPPAKTKSMLKGKEWEWTPWDSLDINLGDITMGEFMDYFEEQYNLEISMLSYGVSILYSFFANKKKVEERKAMKMTDVITSITKKEFPPNQLFIILEVIANDKDTDDEVEVPYIRFRFRSL